jgi:LPXTG-motif cell wall-anchored protein
MNENNPLFNQTSLLILGAIVAGIALVIYFKKKNE